MVPSLEDPRNITGTIQLCLEALCVTLYALTDSYALQPQPSNPGSVPPLYDIPIAEVNKVMFARQNE